MAPTASLQPEFYIPLDQMPAEAWDWTGRTMTVVARVDRETDARRAAAMAAIRDAVRAVDPGIPCIRMRPMRDLVRGATAEARFNTLLLGLLGAVGTRARNGRHLRRGRLRRDPAHHGSRHPPWR
jgi:hypothetical protein